MQDPLLDAQRRLQRAWSADGLSEIAAGILLFLPALFEWSKTSFTPHSNEWRALNLIQMLVIFPGVWIARWSIPRIRNRLFGQRDGFMLPRIAPEGGSKAVAVAIVAAMAAAIAVLIKTNGAGVAAITIFLGLAVAALLFRTGRAAGIRRYPAMGIAIAVVSIPIALRATNFETAFTWQFGFMGALCTVTGIVTLRRFLGQRS